MLDRLRRTPQLWLFSFVYGVLIVASLVSFVRAGVLQLGRKPLEKLVKTADELSRPSFIDAWYGEREFAYRDDQGRVLRVEDKRAVERRYLIGLADAA